MSRRSWLGPAILAAVAGAVLLAPASKVRADDVPDEAAVSHAVDEWIAALNAMLAGDPAPFASLFSHADDVLYMSGEGTYRVGWAATWADWQEQARKSLGGNVWGDDIHVILSGDIATVALIAHATVVGPDGKERALQVRHTNVFRKEAGVWKMIVHHADNIPVWDAIIGGKG